MNAFARARRRFNRGLYGALYHVYRGAFPTRVPPTRIDPTTVRRILVVRHDAIGDMVVTLPTLAYLHALAPQAEIDVLASPRNATLLADDARVHEVIEHDRRWASWWHTVRELRRRHYDVVISAVHNPNFYEGLLAAAIAAPRTARVSAKRPKQYAGFFTHVIRVPPSQRHMARRLLYVVHRVLGDPRDPLPDLDTYPARLRAEHATEARVDAWLAAHVGCEFVALNAWARDAVREFGVSLAADIAAGIVARHPSLGVVVTPPPHARAEADAIVRRARELAPNARIVVADGTGLQDLIAVIERARIVVSVDTANVHLASAAGVPVVSVVTPRTIADAAVWAPWGVAYRTVHVPADRAVRDADPSDVLAAFDALLASLPTA